MALVDVQIRDRIATVTLDDPEQRNALSPPLLAELVAAFDTLEADDGVGAIVLTGRPPAFCAGARRGNLPQATSDDADPKLSLDADALLRVGRSILPIVVAVNGAAVGAGMNLALSGDVTLIGTSGWMESRFASLGIHPGGGHSWLVSTSAGRQAAAAAALFGRRFEGHQAVAAGLALACVPDEQLVDQARAVAEGAARLPRELAVAIKASLRKVPSILTHEEAVEFDLERVIWSRKQAWS